MGEDKEDVVQEGMIGIFKAIGGYSREKAASFQTFAEICVHRQILTAIKAASRLKHSPLNTSLSIHMPINTEEREVGTLEDTLGIVSGEDPESLLIYKENMDYIEGREGELFSDMELRVWSEYLKGRTYTEIAKSLGKTPKAVDNAIQRTKKKLTSYLSS